MRRPVTELTLDLSAIKMSAILFSQLAVSLLTNFVHISLNVRLKVLLYHLTGGAEASCDYVLTPHFKDIASDNVVWKRVWGHPVIGVDDIYQCRSGRLNARQHICSDI